MMTFGENECPCTRYADQQRGANQIKSIENATSAVLHRNVLVQELYGSIASGYLCNCRNQAFTLRAIRL